MEINKSMSFQDTNQISNISIKDYLSDFKLFETNS